MRSSRTKFIGQASTMKPSSTYHGPRKVGGTYLCGYWRNTYEVVAISGYNVTVKWLDGDSAGQTRTHSTPWDHRMDRVIGEPVAV